MKATHQCVSCLKKTIEDCTAANLPKRMVFAGSECGPRRPAHVWKEIGNCHHAIHHVCCCASHFFIALSALKSLYISHLMFPSIQHRCFEFNSISWLTPHLSISFASFCIIAQAGGRQSELWCCYVVRCCCLCGVIFLTDIVVLILVICFNHLWGYSLIRRFEWYFFFFLTSLSLVVFYTRGENTAIATQVSGSTFENIVLNWAMYVHDLFFIGRVIWQCFRGLHGRVQLWIDRRRGNPLENSLQTRGRSESGN